MLLTPSDAFRSVPVSAVTGGGVFCFGFFFSEKEAVRTDITVFGPKIVPYPLRRFKIRDILFFNFLCFDETVYLYYSKHKTK